MIGAWSGGAPASVLENLCVTQQYAARYAEKDFRYFGNLKSSGQFRPVSSCEIRTNLDVNVTRRAEWSETIEKLRPETQITSSQVRTNLCRCTPDI